MWFEKTLSHLQKKDKRTEKELESHWGNLSMIELLWYLPFPKANY
jgi:hypothetical protein